jgi:hypothetical protein
MNRRFERAEKAGRNTPPPYGLPLGPATGQGTATRAADKSGRPIAADALAGAQGCHDPYRTATRGEGPCL